MGNSYRSWGRYPIHLDQDIRQVYARHEINLARLNKNMLPYGNGRSYGDCCLNEGGTLIDIRGLNRFIAFDSEKGILKCEAGVLLSEIIKLVLPQGWFLSVTPGTQFVTVGGAIANDVHGKNHHSAATFGCHLRGFELLRSNGSYLFCSREVNSDYFSATIGGLGLTGIVTWAEFSLKKVSSSYVNIEKRCFKNLDEFFSLSEKSNKKYEYTVAWVDCMAKGSSLGRGVFVRANHQELIQEGDGDKTEEFRMNKMYFPIDPPFSLINLISVKVFNEFYFYKNNMNQGVGVQSFSNFFYPLDTIQNWNRVYGRRGFLQFQCVVPMKNAKKVLEKILERIAYSGQGSFLSVLKMFGEKESPGMLSFPRPGVTLALDFPNKGKKLFDLLNELEQVVVIAGGGIYPAKDARMSPETFKEAFPKYQEFRSYIDPNFSSSFWRRMLGENN